MSRRGSTPGGASSAGEPPHSPDSAADQLQAVLFEAIDVGPFGFAVIGGDGTVLHLNAAANRVLGRASGDVVGRGIEELVHPDDRGWVKRELELMLAGTTDRVHYEVRLLSAGGDEQRVELSARRTVSGEQVGATVLLDAVGDRTARERELQRLADSDPLTDLYNRRRFTGEFDRHIAWADRYGARGALLVIDIDDLKAINDGLGHLAGDAAIVATARLLKGRVRASDITARIGGDEFAVLLPAAGAADASALATALIHGIREMPPAIVGRPLTLSIGVAALTEQIDAASLFERADTAMYEVKRLGGNGYALDDGRSAVAVPDWPPAGAPASGAEGQQDFRRLDDPAPSSAHVELTVLLQTVAELSAASPGLVAWELATTEANVAGAWDTAARAGLIERTRYDLIDQQWQYSLTPAGEERLRMLESTDDDDEYLPDARSGERSG